MKRGFLAVVATVVLTMLSLTSCENEDKSLTIEGQWCRLEAWMVGYNTAVLDVNQTHPNLVLYASGYMDDVKVSFEATVTGIKYESGRTSGTILTNGDGKDGSILFKDLTKDHVSIFINNEYVEFVRPSSTYKLYSSEDYDKDGTADWKVLFYVHKDLLNYYIFQICDSLHPSLDCSGVSQQTMDTVSRDKAAWEKMKTIPVVQKGMITSNDVCVLELPLNLKVGDYAFLLKQGRTTTPFDIQNDLYFLFGYNLITADTKCEYEVEAYAQAGKMSKQADAAAMEDAFTTLWDIFAGKKATLSFKKLK